MKRALVLGGTRFFGKRLVLELIADGWQVTVASRGLAEDSFGERVSRLTIDRYSTESLRSAFMGKDWDVVYDQICYAPDDAMDSCQLLSGKVGRYVFTSTGSVYKDVPLPYTEEYFDPYSYPLVMGRRESFDYGEGKRLAEAVFFQKADFPVAAMRIPVVVGPDDYTKRLAGVVKFVMQGQVMRSPDMDKKIGFISSAEAGRFLHWLGTAPVTGPYNAAATGFVTMGDLFSLVEKTVGREALLSPQAEQDSPLRGSSYLNNTKATEAGYAFSSLMEWLPALVAELRDMEETD